MRIGIVCPYDLAASGGVQQLTRELAERLLSAGDEVVLVGPGGHDDSGFVPVGRATPIRANRSRVPISLDPRSYTATRRALAEVDVVHVHEPLVPVVGWGGVRRDKPLVATFHADPARWSRGLYRLLARPVGSWLEGAHLTAVSEVAASALPRRWGSVELIPNAIDTAAYVVDVERQPGRVAFLGRDDPRKGLDVLLAAWARVLAEHPAAELLVIGATRPGDLPGVRYLGRVDEAEKRRLLASSAVYVAPHLGGESFGLVVAEAMASGCAVVASDLPAFRAVLAGSGRLVPPGDPTALAESLIRLCGNPDAVETLGSAGREAAKRFDWSRVLGAYRATYESALGEDPSTIG